MATCVATYTVVEITNERGDNIGRIENTAGKAFWWALSNPGNNVANRVFPSRESAEAWVRKEHARNLALCLA